MTITEKYTTEVEPISNGEGYWNSLKVKIIQNEPDGTKKQIGEYLRNYSSLYGTFCPFEQNGKEYALYSKNYTATRVMALPSCEDICGEEACGCGFCPTGYYVPPIDPDECLKGEFGFMCGCVWGDDSSWKIQYLDLSKISEGILKREDRFGYIELVGSHKELKNAIEISIEEYEHEGQKKRYARATIACACHFDLDTGEKV